MNTPTELRAKSLRIQHEARAKLETINADGSNAAEVEAEFDRMLVDADALEARAKRFEDLEAREAALNVADARRPSEDRSITGSNETLEVRQSEAFNAYLRGDIAPEQRAILRELRAQNVATPADGGYLVPQTWADSLIVGLKAYGPMVNGGVVNFLSTSTGATLNLPTLDDTANEGRRIAEGVTVNNANLAFANKQLDAYKYTSDAILVSSELFQDSAIDIQKVIVSAMSERIGRILNKELTVGTGSSQPNGIVTAVTANTPLAANAVLSLDAIIDLQDSVDPAYQDNAGFMMNVATRSVARKLKDADGRPLWVPSVQAGVAGTLFDKPVYINTNMATYGSGNKSILYGDFSKYTVRQSAGFVLKRLDERYADSDQVGFIGFCRFDGELMDSRAIRALANA